MGEFRFEAAEKLDHQDTLAKFKNDFYIKPEELYLDGNSLGLMSKQAEQAVYRMMEQWKTHGINGWTNGDHPWFYLSEELGEKTAPLVGAKKEEVITTGSITTNLHQLLATFYRPEGKRKKILADALTFPSDIYALKSQVRLHGLDPDEVLVQVGSKDGRTIEEADIIAAMEDDVAVVMLPSVLYRSGQLLNIRRLTEAAHERGILIGFDLAHSIGAMPHALHDDGVDFAVWCTYKHLNAGPGAVGGLYVHERHFGKQPGLAGWFGSKKDKQFDMAHTMSPAESAGAYQIGTPHVLSCAPLLGSLEIFKEAGIEAIREKSLKLTAYLMDLIEERLSDFGFVIANPREDDRRGGHVSLEHPESARICKALKANGIIPDFRKPNGIRLAPVALYTSFTDVWYTVDRLKQIMEQEEYKNFTNERDVVA